MLTSKQYRAKSADYSQLTKSVRSPNEVRDQNPERSFTALADNEQRLVGNRDQTVHAKDDRPRETDLAEEDQHVLQCLGAALITRWNTLPTTLQRELFDNASSVGELLDADPLKGHIARFLHKHKDDGQEPCAARVQAKRETSIDRNARNPPKDER
jgi:hypothetical protein